MYEDQRTAPYGSPQAGRVFLHQFKHGSPGRGPLIFAVVAALLGLALGAASLALLITYKSTATAQIRQLQQAAVNAQVSDQGNTSSINGLSGKVSAIEAVQAALAPYSKVCSTDLSGPAGPAQFYFLCTDVKPGG